MNFSENQNKTMMWRQFKLKQLKRIYFRNLGPTFMGGWHVEDVSEDEQTANEEENAEQLHELFALSESTSRVTPAKKRKVDSLTTANKAWGRAWKPDPFPVNTAPTKKLEAWLDWKQQFRVALESVGDLSERMKANFLFMSIGNEVRKIIQACAMMPDKDQVEEEFPHYTNLEAELEEYFRSSTDSTINLNAFSNMRQEPKEGSKDFFIRLTRQAALCGLHGATDLLRNNFVNGMKDRELSERAFVDNWKIDEIVAAATRKEALIDVKGEFRPWANDVKSSVVEVAAIEGQRGPFRATRPTFRYQNKQQRYDNGRAAPRPKQQLPTQRYKTEPGGESLGNKPCPNCGIRTHRYGTCPANGKACNSCGKTGHFARMCRNKINAIENNDEPSKEDSEEVKIFA